MKVNFTIHGNGVSFLTVLLILLVCAHASAAVEIGSGSTDIISQRNWYSINGKSSRLDDAIEPEVAPAGSAAKKTNSGFGGRKRLLEMRVGSWGISPGLALKFGRGYDFSIGPKLNFRRSFSENRSLNLSTRYLPLSFSDVLTDGKIKLFSVSSNFRNHFRPRFFYEIGLGLNSFRPDSVIRDYVTSQGGKIGGEDLLNGSISLAYQLFHIPFSYKKRRRKVLFYLKLTWREGEEYTYGADFGKAGTGYKSSRKGLSVSLHPMLRKF